MKTYLELVDRILTEGTYKSDRTGTGTYSIFAPQLRFDLNASFPLVTTKKIHFKSVLYELLWFIGGHSNVKWLQERSVTIWNEWAAPDGELGPVYGVQWRKWKTADGRVIDQLADAIQQLQTNPDSRRIIVNAWNVGEIPQMALPPCHLFFQFYVANNKLSCQMYQRSADVFLGVPFNIASYALLTLMVAQVTNLTPGELIITFGDAHLYANHLEQAKLQLARSPHPLPQIQLNPAIRNIDDFKFEDVTLLNYQFDPAIAAPIAV